MKKIFIFLTLFLFVSSTKALTKIHLKEQVPNMYIESIYENKITNKIPFILLDEKENFVYSLNPFEELNTSDSFDEYNYNDQIFNLSNEQLNKINIIAYYGYGYDNHTDIKWYGITQFMIWKTLNFDAIYFTDQNGNKITVYEEELEELENLVNKHLILPNFANREFEFSIYSTTFLSDYNKVFPFYEVKYSDFDFYFRNSLGYVTTKGEGTGEIVFVRKSPIEKDYILYSGDSGNNFISPGRINDVEFFVKIKATSGSITINKSNNANKFVSEEGAVYEIYDENKLITTVETNEEGTAKILNLPWKKTYTIKEKTPSKGYKKDNNLYEIAMNKLNKNVVLNLSSDVIEGNLIINKYCGDQLEEGALFQIYDMNNNLIGEYETKEGIINVKLEYGEYYVTQVSGKSGYDFATKFEININEEKDYVIDLYSNKKETLIVEVPNTKKYDYNKFIPSIFIIIGLIFIFKSKKKTTNY